MARFYTGVGSRKTPTDILDLMQKLADRLQSEHGFILRSGGAIGADSAFEDGAGTINSEIFYARDCTPAAEAIAAQFHPAWHRCSEFARQLHGRNAFQVLGRDLQTPSEFVVCWTSDGCNHHSTRSITTGGTGTAISIASAHNIPVYNMAQPAHLERISRYVK